MIRKKKAAFAALAAGMASAFLIAAQDNPPETQDNSSNRLHPLETFTVEYQLTGEETGTSVEHWRDWGHSRVEILRVSSQKDPYEMMQGRIIYSDDDVTSINETTRQGEIIDNAEDQDSILAAQDDDPAAFTDKLMMALGGTKTGDVKEIAGEKCTMWSQSKFSEQCVTDDGIALYQKSLVWSPSERMATAVRRGDPGPDEAFNIDPSIKLEDRRTPPGVLE